MALLPNSGEVMIRGALCGRGVRIKKSWLRESIQRVDPTRREIDDQELEFFCQDDFGAVT